MSGCWGCFGQRKHEPKSREGQRCNYSYAERRLAKNRKKDSLVKAAVKASQPPTNNLPDVKDVQKSKCTEETIHNESAKRSAAGLSTAVQRSRTVEPCAKVLLYCHLWPDVLLPKAQMEAVLEKHLADGGYENEEESTATLIHTANKLVRKVNECVEALCEIMLSLLLAPEDPLSRELRCEDELFAKKIEPVIGATKFLTHIGFQRKRIKYQGHEDDFYLLPKGFSVDADRLAYLKGLLTNAQPIYLKVWRDPRLFRCTASTADRFGELPSEFYPVSKEATKREQQEALEQMGMLRTKAMRERDKLKELRRYRYTLLRIRFPQDIYLQAIFKSNETLHSLLEYIKEQLEFEWLPFWLSDASGKRLTDEQRTLAELQLVPACVINFGCDKQMLAEAHQNSGKPRHVLQPSLLDRLENWSI